MKSFAPGLVLKKEANGSLKIAYSFDISLISPLNGECFSGGSVILFPLKGHLL